MRDPAEFVGQRVVVMGLGRFGGGVGVTRFLVGRGASVLVTDQDPAEKLSKSIAELQNLIDQGRVTLRLGEHRESDFTSCDLVVVNPAVKPGNVYVQAAERAGIEVTTEMRLLVQRLPNRFRTIGVTGSAGKSTVTAMIGHVLGKVMADGGWRMADGKQKDATLSVHPPSAIAHRPSPRVWVGGNIGGSLLPHLEEIGEDDWVVLELSSFMLERLKKDAHFPGWSPHIAVITNISPNHLDWHGSMEGYVGSKRQLISDQCSGDVVFSIDSIEAMFGQKPISDFLDYANRSDTHQFEKISPLPGEHNQKNAWLSYLVVSKACINSGIEISGARQLTEIIATFPGLPHRLQLVAEHNGVRYFNDSKCTTPEAAKLAIEAFLEADAKPGIHLILGGYDKGSDFASLAGLASEKCKGVYTIGKTGDTIAELADTAAEAASAGVDRPSSCGGVSWPAGSAQVVRCGDLQTAVAEIGKRVVPGDVVLLSPACASWDQFENYEQRGERFIELIKRMIES